MPNRDMSGPRGMGPMTGRGFGFGRNADPYYENIIPNASRKNILENQMNMLKDQLSLLEKELSNLKDENQKEEGED